MRAAVLLWSSKPEITQANLYSEMLVNIFIRAQQHLNSADYIIKLEEILRNIFDKNDEHLFQDKTRKVISWLFKSGEKTRP